MDICSFYYLGFTHLKLFDKNLLHIIQEFNFSKPFIRLMLTKRKQIIEKELFEKKEYNHAIKLLKSKFTSLGNYNTLNSHINNLYLNNREWFSFKVSKILEFDICKKYGYQLIIDTLEQDYKGFEITYVPHNETIYFKWSLYT